MSDYSLEQIQHAWEECWVPGMTAFSDFLEAMPAATPAPSDVVAVDIAEIAQLLEDVADAASDGHAKAHYIDEARRKARELRALRQQHGERS